MYYDLSTNKAVGLFSWLKQAASYYWENNRHYLRGKCAVRFGRFYKAYKFYSAQEVYVNFETIHLFFEK